MTEYLGHFLNSITHFDFYVVITIVTFIYCAKRGLLPSTEAVRRLTSMLDDRGGNILVLVVLTSWFVVMTVKMFYFAIDQIANKHVTADNAILLMALNTIASGFAGTCFGALLKTMSGSMTVAPPNASTSGGTLLPAGNPSNYPSLASPPGVVSRPGTDVHIDTLQEGHFGGG